MTPQEAREILSKINISVGMGESFNLSENQILEATSMAIEALEQDPILDTRQRERQLEIEYQHGYDKGWEEGRKALEQQPCEDCVSRTDVLKVMCEKCPVYDCITGCQSYRSIEKMPPVTPKTEWIPCSERLPEEKDYRACQENLDGAVLWCTERGMIGLGWYYESTKAWADIHDEEIEKQWGKIIAWMPLPETIKGEGEQ